MVFSISALSRIISAICTRRPREQRFQSGACPFTRLPTPASMLARPTHIFVHTCIHACKTHPHLSPHLLPHSRGSRRQARPPACRPVRPLLPPTAPGGRPSAPAAAPRSPPGNEPLRPLPQPAQQGERVTNECKLQEKQVVARVTRTRGGPQLLCLYRCCASSAAPQSQPGVRRSTPMPA